MGPGGRRGRFRVALEVRFARGVVYFRGIGTGSLRSRLWFGAIEPADDISTNRPRGDLGGLAFLALAVRRHIRRTDEAAFDQDVSAFLIVVATRSAKSGRNTTTRCHSVFELHSPSAFFQERCVATDSTVNFEPLPFA